MRYCYNCGSITAGKPRFCNVCGRSYDVKLCPRFHANPVEAQVCSECGSPVLSTPQPRHPWWIRPLKLFWALLPGAGLLLLSGIYLAVYVRLLVKQSPWLLPFMFAGLALGGMWLLFISLSVRHRTRPPRS